MKNWQIFLVTSLFASISGCASTSRIIDHHHSINGQPTREYFFADSTNETQNQQVERVNYIYCSFTKNCD